MRQNTGKKFYLQKETDKNTQTRDNLWIICFKQKHAKSKVAANNTKYTHSPTQTHKPVVGLRPEVFSEETQQQKMIKNDFFEKCIRTTTTRTSARERDMPEMSRETA